MNILHGMVQLSQLKNKCWCIISTLLLLRNLLFSFPPIVVFPPGISPRWPHLLWLHLFPHFTGFPCFWRTWRFGGRLVKYIFCKLPPGGICLIFSWRVWGGSPQWWAVVCRCSCRTWCCQHEPHGRVDLTHGAEVVSARVLCSKVALFSYISLVCSFQEVRMCSSKLRNGPFWIMPHLKST